MTMVRYLGWLLAGLMAAVGQGWAQDPAANYPSRPVRWVIPFTPGASNDIIGRLVAGKLSEAMGQQFIIDNRPGAGGIVGAETVARANPDGYTLLLTNPGPSVNTILLRKNLSYGMSDFTPIVWIGYTPFYVFTSLSFPPRSVKELVDYAKANPGKVAWASSGVGSSPHIALAVFQLATGINVTHVPYKGTVQPLIDMVGGQIQVLSTTTLSAEAQIKAATASILIREKAHGGDATYPDTRGAGHQERGGDRMVRHVGPGENPAPHHGQAQPRGEQGTATGGRQATP